MKLHGGQEVVPEPGSTTNQSVDRSTWDAKKHQPSIDGTSVVGKATWPSHKPEAASCVASELSLMRLLHAGNRWEDASQAWYCHLIRRGTVWRHRNSEQLWLSLGDVGFTSVLSWPLERRSSPAGVVTFSPVCTGARAAAQFQSVTQWEDAVVLPAHVVSPLHRAIAEGHKLLPCLGITMRCTYEADRPLLTRSYERLLGYSLILPQQDRQSSRRVRACANLARLLEYPGQSRLGRPR